MILFESWGHEGVNLFVDETKATPWEPKKRATPAQSNFLNLGTLVGEEKQKRIFSLVSLFCYSRVVP